MKKELSTGFNARQYMNSGEFEVFFYNDIDLDHVVDHTHPYYEIYFFLNGDVTYEVDGNRYELQYGDYLMIPPETRHHPIFHSTGQDYRIRPLDGLFLPAPFKQDHLRFPAPGSRGI